MRIIYSEFKPSQQLSQFVECYCMQSFEGDPEEYSPTQRCLPLGTMELLIHLDGKNTEILKNEKWQYVPTAFFTGLYHEPTYWRAQGNLRLFGLRLKPEAFMELFGLPSAKLICTYTEMEIVCPDATDFLQSLYGQDIETILKLTENFFLKRLAHTQVKHSIVKDATRVIRDTAGAITIDELSYRLNISSRQLQRCFKDHIGISPKAYQRLIRFRNAIAALNVSPKGDFADITYGLGYSDQAHFIREFKEFTGQSPATVVKNADCYHKSPLELTAADIIL